MIYISASNGIYSYDDAARKVSVIMDNNYRGGFFGSLFGGLFAKKSHGYFGICYSEYSDEIIVSSREKLGTPRAGKPTTDCGIHAINPVTDEYRTIGYVKDVHDVHQIAVWKSQLLLTDTGKNRVVVYDIDARRITCMINIGNDREDINHVNAVTVLGNKVYIGLNNRGNTDSEILVMPADVLESGFEEVDAESVCSTITLQGIRHTHDVEPFGETFLVSVSHDSRVIAADTLAPVFDGENWVRGLCIKDDNLWIGQSHFAKRSKRHKKVNDGALIQYDLAGSAILQNVTLNDAGQINDLITI